MPLIPFAKFDISSPLSGTEAASRIDAVTYKARRWDFLGRYQSNQLFVGTVEGSKFNIHRNIKYRNSFLPYLSGSIEALPSGSSIRVSARLHFLVLPLLIFILGVFVKIWVEKVILPNLFVTSPEQAFVSTLSLLGVFLFVYALSVIAFNWELKKTMADLEKCLSVQK